MKLPDSFTRDILEYIGISDLPDEKKHRYADILHSENIAAVSEDDWKEFFLDIDGIIQKMEAEIVADSDPITLNKMIENKQAYYNWANAVEEQVLKGFMEEVKTMDIPEVEGRLEEGGNGGENKGGEESAPEDAISGSDTQDVF